MERRGVGQLGWFRLVDLIFFIEGAPRSLCGHTFGMISFMLKAGAPRDCTNRSVSSSRHITR